MPEIKPRFDWLKDPRLLAIVSALTKDGQARLVGGCVRDGLLGQTPLESDAIDIDIATDRTPTEMKIAFAGAGIRAVATGEDHGTITAIKDGLVAECTTLRADLDTDGRHAKVRFTRDWNEDWRRRDFTINALYLSVSGEIWDPGNGQSDLEAGRVHFIGDPTQRITEDALRILRFFRFSSRFADQLDPRALEAIKTHAALLDNLSKERIYSEVRRIFKTPRAAEVLSVAAQVGVLLRVIPQQARTTVLAALHQRGVSDVATSLAALWPNLSREALRTHLKPPNALLDRYEAVHKACDGLTGGVTNVELVYRYPRDIPYLAAELALAEGFEEARERSCDLKNAEPLHLPIAGGDIVDRGVTPGPEVRTLMKEFERLWLLAGAPVDAASTETLLQSVLRRQTPG